MFPWRKSKEYFYCFRCSTLETSNISNRQIATGDFSGNLSIWDLETMKPEKTVKAHADVLTCISGDCSTSTNILTGEFYGWSII